MKEFIMMAKTISAKEWTEGCTVFGAMGILFLVLALIF